MIPALRRISAAVVMDRFLDPSALTLDSPAGMLLAPSPERLHLDRREPFEPCTQVIGEHKRAAAALDCAEFAGLDCLVESSAPGAGNSASFSDGISERQIHA